MEVNLATDIVNIPVLSGKSYPEATWSSLNISEATSDIKKYERVTSKLVEMARSQNVMWVKWLVLPVKELIKYNVLSCCCATTTNASIASSGKLK